MPNLKELKADAKSRGLKKYSTLSKDAIIRLIDLDKTGKAPIENMTNKRKKELKTSAKEPIDTLTALKPPKVPRSMLMKRVKEEWNDEIADLSKKTISDLKTL
jgi:hypothetical protein